MGMSAIELHQITPRSLFNKFYGYQKVYRENWERTRLQCYFSFSPIDPQDPEKKRLLPIEKFMPLAWDGKKELLSVDAYKKRIEKANKLWAKIDEQNKNRDVGQ